MILAIIVIRVIIVILVVILILRKWMAGGERREFIVNYLDCKRLSSARVVVGCTGEDGCFRYVSVSVERGGLFLVEGERRAEKNSN